MCKQRRIRIRINQRLDNLGMLVLSGEGRRLKWVREESGQKLHWST
uniref:Transcriptional regulator n=1 Tax=Ascaris lumbricoides TaxID=6252 RepID=A0A0M3IQJ0_ASCLU